MKHWHANKTAGLNTSRTLGNTNTHQTVADLVVGTCINWDQVDANTRFLEPAVGMGSFYRAIADRLLARGYAPDRVFGHQIVGLDVDANALAICRTSLAEAYGEENAAMAALLHEDFWGGYWPETPFDWIVTNPPYVSAARTTPPFGGDKDQWIAATSVRLPHPPAPRSDLYALFYAKALPLLAPGGRCVFLCSDSWVDGEFGSTLKSMVLDAPWGLERVVNSQLHPFFRDDTNAIITLIRRLCPGEARPDTVVENWRGTQWGDPATTQTTTWTPAQLDGVLRGPGLANRRNAWFLFGPEHAWVEDTFQRHAGAFERIEQACTLRTSSVGAAFFPKDKQGRGQGGDTPVFWQLQARTNRKPDYRTCVPTRDLPLWVDGAQPGPLGKPLPVVENALFLSTIVDRFPLVFYTDAPVVHVNKYVALFPRHGLPLWATAAAIESIPAVLSLEQSTKEGTRKTLRKGEFGLAKEMSKGDIAQIRIPRLDTLPDLSALESHIRAYQDRVIYNLEDALHDPDYWAVQVELAQQLGYGGDLLAMTRMAVFLYVLRMRHLEKLADFDTWYGATHGARLAEATPVFI